MSNMNSLWKHAAHGCVVVNFRNTVIEPNPGFIQNSTRSVLFNLWVENNTHYFYDFNSQQQGGLTALSLGQNINVEYNWAISQKGNGYSLCLTPNCQWVCIWNPNLVIVQEEPTLWRHVHNLLSQILTRDRGWRPEIGKHTSTNTPRGKRGRERVCVLLDSDWQDA